MAKDPNNRYATTVELADAACAAIAVPIERMAPPQPTSSENWGSPGRAPQAHQHDYPPPTHGSPYPPPRLPSAQEQTTSRGPNRSTKVTLAVCAAVILAIAAVVGTVALTRGHSNSAGPGQREVPDVRGQAAADAIAALQSRGFNTWTLQKPDSTIPPDHVISTDPNANASVAAGTLITVDVSTGPEQRQVPDVAGLSYADAVTKLKAAGFSMLKEANSPSIPEMKDKVVTTAPPANQTLPTTVTITIIVGSGPATNQFVMPDLTGMYWTDAEPRLRALGWTGVLDKGPDIDTGGAQHNKIASQSPAAGTGVNKDGIITLSFGQ